jgi:molybdopterin converting factor small subunit
VATVWIPSLLRPLTGGQRQVTAAGATVGEIIADLDRAYPGMRDRLCQGDRLQSGIAVAVDGETGTLGLLEPVPPDSEVQILPAIGGG